MENTLSRRDFLKGMAAGALSIGAMSALPALTKAYADGEDAAKPSPVV